MSNSARAIGRGALLPFVVAALAITSTAPASAAPTDACALDEREVWDLNLSLEAEARVYEIGETAKVTVTVTRPDDYDPVSGQTYIGELPYSEPVEDVNVGAGVVVEGVYLLGYGFTDAEGKVTLSIKIEPWTPPGKAVASFLGTKTVIDVPCLKVTEIGTVGHPALFKVKPRR